MSRVEVRLVATIRTEKRTEERERLVLERVKFRRGARTRATHLMRFCLFSKKVN